MNVPNLRQAARRCNCWGGRGGGWWVLATGLGELGRPGNEMSTMNTGLPFDRVPLRHHPMDPRMREDDFEGAMVLISRSVPRSAQERQSQACPACTYYKKTARSQTGHPRLDREQSGAISVATHGAQRSNPYPGIHGAPGYTHDTLRGCVPRFDRLPRLCRTAAR